MRVPGTKCSFALKLCEAVPSADEVRVPGEQEMIDELAMWLIDITGFDAMSMQPNAGASGEYAGLMAIRVSLRPTP